MTMFNSFLFEISALSRVEAVKGVNGFRRAVRSLALAAVMATAVGALGLGASSPAMAQAEPTLKQIYETAAAGKLPEAQVMVQQVLVAHPKSAKAHFVQAEMFSRQGNLLRAREALAEADRLEPGLPFVKPEVVQVLRKQLEARPSAAAGGTKALNAPQSRTESSASMNAVAPAGSSFPWGVGLALGIPVLAAAVYFGLKKKSAPPAATGFRNAAADNNSYNNNTGTGTGTGAMPTAATGGMGGAGSGLSGPQTFGSGGAPAPSPYGQNYAQPGQAGYGQPGYGQGQPGQQAGGGMMSGMGGRVAGGLATGLAVGAGVMAAQAIGRSFSGNDQAGHADKMSANAGNNSNAANPGSLAGDAGDPMGGGNRDMGGQNFGFNDAAGNSWDDGGSADTFSADAGGGDWDT